MPFQWRRQRKFQQRQWQLHNSGGDSAHPGVTASLPSDLALSDNSIQITIHKLKLLINGKRKLGCLNGEIKALRSCDPTYIVWRSDNSMVMVCLINSMDPAVGKPFMFLPTAQNVWEASLQKLQRPAGKLIYLFHTRPDITFVVSLVSQFMHAPCKEHLDAVHRTLWYQK